jgi:cobalt-zinc-cadmium efflux system membrane fusion protein
MSMNAPIHVKKTLAAAALAAVSAVGLASLAGCGNKSQAATAPPAAAARPEGEVWLTPAQVRDAKIQVADVGEQSVDDTILTSGTVTLDDQRTGHVFSPVTGRVVNISAQLGQHVKKGDSLAVIESPDIGSAIADVHKAQADLIAADHDLKRKKDLFEQKAGSASDLESAQDTYRRAKAEVERADEKERLLRVGNADAVSQTFSLAAPVDGEVLMRNINPGIEVQGQYSGGTTQELFTIGELDHVWVIGDLYEMDFARVKVGAPAVVTVVAYPGKTFTGVVDWVSGSLDPVMRTAKVRCNFDNKDRFLRPMMYATVQISVDQKRALAIPRDALLRLGDSKIVFIETGEGDGLVKFKRMPVDVDEGESSQWLEVKKGLQPGQKIVTAGAILLAANLE